MNSADTTSRRVMRLALSALLAVALAAAALAGCAKAQDERIRVAAEYVRCSVNADYRAMSKLVAKPARPYCYAMAAAPKSDGTGVKIVNETWEQDALIFEIGFGPVSTFLRLSPPKDSEPNDIMVESWNKQGARSTGTLTVSETSDGLVVTHVDGKPIEEVLAVGSGGL